MKSTHIRDYRLIARLGRGSLTDVFLTLRNGTLDRLELAAIKRIRDDVMNFGAHKSYEALLLDESRLAVRLHHPNIMRTVEAAIDEQLPFRSLEYLEGQLFDRVLAWAGRAGGLPVEQALLVIDDMLAALSYAHDLSDDDGNSFGLVHRDLNPHNIFVTYDGEVKLCDFGAPKQVLRAASSDSELIDSSNTYLAPEQALRMSVDRRADIFAVGVVMWECLATQRLLAADSPATTREKLLYEPIPKLAEVRSDLDPALTALCDRALERDPSERYQSAAEMRADLALLLESTHSARVELRSLMQHWFEGEREERAVRVAQLLPQSEPVRRSIPAPPLPAQSPAPVPPPAAAKLLEAEHEHERERGRELEAEPTYESEPELEPEPTYELEPEPPLPIEPELEPDTEPELAAPPRHPTMLRSEPPPSIPPPLPKLGARRTQYLALALAAFAIGFILAWSRWPKSTSEAAASQPAAAVPEHAALAKDTDIVVRLCGSNTIGAELAPALAEAFLASKGGTALERRPEPSEERNTITAKVADVPLGIEVSARGSATAFTGLAEGKCDIGMASRPINDNEVAAIRERGFGDLHMPGSEHVIALDGIAMIVHASNPVRALDRSALHDIYTGKISDWSAVGGSAGPISVLARDSKSGTYDIFKNLVLGPDDLVSGAKRYVENAALSDAVAGDPSAIGFVGLPYVRTAKPLAVSEAGAAPMLPTRFTVATEGYMLSRRLYLYTLPKPRSPWATEFVSFALSRRAQEIAARNQFIDLGLTTRDMPCDAQCSPRYAAVVAKAQRMSVDFRFRSGSNEPDSRAGRDIERVVGFLGDHAGSKLRLLGFSDTIGNQTANLRLSLDRAKAIEQELEIRGVHAAVVTGFGAEMPVASNETEPGRERNRRVEAWVEY